MRKRMLCILASAAMCIGCLPATALAADSREAVQLGTGEIHGWDGEGYDYIYFGKWQNYEDDAAMPLKWRVLDEKANTGEEGLFLMTEKLLSLSNTNPGADPVGDVYFSRYDVAKNTWQGSDAQKWCTDFAGVTDNAYSASTGNADVPAALTAAELAAVQATTKSDASISLDIFENIPAAENILNGDRVFFLSAEESYKGEYGFDDYYRNPRRFGRLDGLVASWWLRTAAADQVAFGTTYIRAHFIRGGRSYNDDGRLEGFSSLNRVEANVQYAARPAFNLDTDKVLFATAADNSGHNESFAAPASYTGSDWKLTLKDANDFSEGAGVSGNISLETGYGAAAVTITHQALSTLSADYTNVTAALTNDAGALLYYGSINDDTDAESSIVTIPAGLAVGTYKLMIRGEDWNDAGMTDYATGTPFTTTITVTERTDAGDDDTDDDDDADDEGAGSVVPGIPSGNGNSSKKKYDVEAIETDDGEITLSRGSASKGTTVKVTVAPKEGYVLEKLIVLDMFDEEVEIKDLGDNVFSFRMPRGDVEIIPVYAKAEKEETSIRLTIGSVLAWVHDRWVTNDVAPELRGGRTMLPGRLVVEGMDGKISWNGAEQKTTIKKGDTEMELFIGASFMLVNGTPVELDSPVYIKEDRTYLPLRIIMEYMDAEVEWDGAAQTVTITPNK